MLKRGDFVLIFYEGKKYLVSVREGQFHTHKDHFDLAELEGKKYGDVIFGKKGTPFFLLRPTIYDFLMRIERKTQIIYPKDIGYILLKLGVGEGKIVIECGCGSGALTTAFAFYVGSSGQVISYEKELAFIELAKANLKRLSLEERVTFKHKEVSDLFDEEEVDAVFLDIKEPWELLKASYKALKPGHPLGILVPTTNQVIAILRELEKLPFVDTEVLEILVRNYKVNSERLRPEDQMIAHTGYLIFTRKIST